jgi:TetR/AcrR family fatty acid metabolism transcriptional regulator
MENRKEGKMANSKAEIRKDQILKAALEVFAEKGFQETTISDVAKKAKLSDPTIYEYFSSKEDLLFSIPGEVVSKGTKELETHLNYIRGATNKIRAIIYHLLSLYQHNSAYASVTMLILKTNRRFLETETYQVVREGYRSIIGAIEEGIASGELVPDTNPQLVRSVILGTIDQIVTRSVLLGSPKNLLELADPLTDLVLDGIRNRERDDRWNISVTLVPAKEKKVAQAPGEAKTRRKRVD